MMQLRWSGGWGGGQRSGGVRIWFTVLLILCGFCCKTGGDVSFETTIVVTSDVTVAMTEDWSTKTIPTTIVASSASLPLPLEGSLSTTAPLDQIPRFTSQPVDVSTLSEILATTTAVFTESYISTVAEEPESSVRVETSSQLQQSLPIFSTAEGFTGEFTPSDIWATSTAAGMEQYTTTVYQNPDDSKSVDVTVASQIGSLTIDSLLTRSHSSFESTLQPSSLLFSQRTDFVTERSVVKETLVSTVLDISQDSPQTDLPESARIILPSRTKTVVPSTLFLSLPVSLQPTSAYMPVTETFSEGYSATPPLLDETLIVTSDIVVTLLTTPLEGPKSESGGISRTLALPQSVSTVQSVSLQSSVAPEDEITFSSTVLLSSIMYLTETSDLLASDVATQLLSSTDNSKSVGYISTNVIEIVTGIITSDMVYTSWISPSIGFPSSRPMLSSIPASTIVVPSIQSSIIPSVIFTEEITSEIFSTVNFEITPAQTLSTRSVGSEMSTIFEELTPTPSLTSENSFSPVITSSRREWDSEISWLTSEVMETLVISSETPIASDTFAFSRGSQSTQSSTIPSVIFGTEEITSEIFSTINFEITLAQTLSTRLVGSEMSTIFEKLTPTPSLISENSVSRSISTIISSNRLEWDSEISWLTSEVLETLVISSEKIMASDTFTFSRGSNDFSISTSFLDGISQSVFDTLSLYETVTVESTLPLPTILPSPVTSQPESTFKSTLGTSEESMVVPSTANSMLYSTVVDLITSDIAVSDDSIKSSETIDSFSFSFPSTHLSIHSSNDLSLQSLVYETITSGTEVIYSTIVQSPSPLPGPESTVQPEMSTPFPSSCMCCSPTTCTCTSPPPSLPPPLCSRIESGSSVIVPTTTLSLDYSIEESFVFETVIITTEVSIYPTPVISEIAPSSDVTSVTSQRSSDLFFTDYPIISTISQLETTIAPSLSYSRTSNVQSAVSNQTESLETFIYTSYFVETSDILYPSSDILPTTLRPVYTYTTMTPEFTALSTLLDQSFLPETIFSSVYETQMSDIFTSLAPTMEISNSFPYSEFSRSTVVPDATQVMSTITDISWTDVYEIISTEVLEYITTDVYDSRTFGTGTDEYQISTLFPTLSQPGLQTESTLVLTMSEEMPPLSSVFMETTVLPIDASVVSYEMSSVLFTVVETSSVMPITPSMPSVYPATSDRQVISDSTAMFTSEIGTTSLESFTQSFLYSTVVDFSTILVSDTITGASSITDSTMMFSSEIGTTYLEPLTSSPLYSTVIDLSTILVSDTITGASSITDSTMMFSSEIGTTSFEPLTQSPLYSTVMDLSTILVTDTITDASSITESTVMFSSEIGTASLVTLAPSFLYSTVIDLSTILVTDTVTDASSIIESTAMVSSEIRTASLEPLTPSPLYSTVMDLSTILVTDTITDASPITDSTVIFSSEIGTTSLVSLAPSFLYSTVIDLSTILVSDTITDASFISPSSSEYYPPPSTPSFSSSVLPSSPFFTPMLPSFTETPYLETSSILIYTTLELESSFPSRSSEEFSSLMTEHSEISYSVSHLSSRYMPSDYLTETLLTSEMVSIDTSDTFPVLISSTGDYLTLVVSGSDTIEPSSLTGIFETISTQVVESSASERIPLLTLTESLQITSMGTLIYTTVQDTVITDSLVTRPTTIFEYSSSASSVSSIVLAPSSRMPEVSTTDVYETVSTATTDFIVPPFSTMAIVTSSIDIMPSPSTAVGATSTRTAFETSMDISLVLETLSVITPTSEVYETISRTMSSGRTIISSRDTYSTSTLTGSYSSMFIPPLITVTPVQTTDYVISTMIGPTTSASETYISTVASSSYPAIESSDVISNVVTDTVSLGSPVVSSDAFTSTLLIPSPSDSLKSESSGFLSTPSGTPPLTSLPSFTTSSLFPSEESPSTLFSELTPTLILPFSSSEVFLSSSVAPQETTSMILSTSSQMVTPSIPPTNPPITTATESPIEVPLEFQLMMDIKVPTSEDIAADDFSEALSNSLEVLYIEGESNILERRRRINREADTPSGDSLDQEWIFTRKQQTEGHPRIRQRLELQEQYGLKEDSQFEGLAKESSAEIEWMFVSKQIGKTSPGIQVRTENKDRRKRQADPSDDIEVPILALSRSDNVDPETLTLTFYVMENETLVMATEAAATYNTLTEGEMSAQLGYAVRSIPQPVIPTPTTTPDYPYTIPPADQTDWLKVTLIVDTAFDETNATFQKQLRNDLEFLYVNGSAELEGNIARNRRDVGMGYADDGVILEDGSARRRRAADPSSATEVALESVDRPQADAENVDVVFYVVDEGSVVPGATALIPYQQLSLQELQDVIGYVVVSPGVALFLTATPTGLDWWWYLLIALIALLLIIVIFLIIYYYCWSKKTAIKTLNKVDRSTSVELGFMRLEKETKAKPVVMETVFDEKTSKRSKVNGSASREADRTRLTEDGAQKRKKRKKTKRAQETTREYSKRGYFSGEDDQLFTHVDTHATKSKTKKPTSTSRLQTNAVYPEPERLPPLIPHSLVAYSETESEISNEQLRMMRKAGMPKSWYTTHIGKDPEELKKDIAREKKRQKRKKEKKIQDQLTAEQMQKEFDAVLGGADEQGIKNPTARQLQVTRTDRWKPRDGKRKSEIPESTGVINESAVRLIRTRPLESAAPQAQNHEDIKREIEELLRRGPPQPVQGPLSTTPSVSQEEAKELAEKKEREVRLRRKWAEERKRINRILDDAFALSSSSLGNTSEQTKGDTPTTSNGQPSLGEREFGKDLEDSGYLRHRGHYGYDALDDSVLPGMIPGRLAMPSRSIPLYETSFGMDLSGEHLYDSIRRPPIEYEFLPSQMRSDGAAPAYGVSVSPIRTQRARVVPYPVRDVLPTDPYRSLNSSLSSSLQPMPITPRNHRTDGTVGVGHQHQDNDQGRDITRVQEENLSLQRLVAKQQRELDHALALIGQPNSRIDQPQKSDSKEGKVGSNGRKQRKVVPVNSAKPLNAPSTVSAWTDDHKAVERKSHPLTSTPNKDNLIKVKPRPSQKEGSVILEHHIEKPGKGSMK